jgi:hypothetical protein
MWIALGFAAAHIALTIGYIIFGRTHYGYGADGGLYADISMNLSAWIDGHRFESEHIHKLVPIALLGFIGHALESPPTEATMMQAFRLLNLMSMLGVCVLGLLISRKLELSPEITFIFFLFTHVNYANTSFLYYAPEHIDAFVTLMGFGIFYLYLTGRTKTLMACILLGAFSRQSILLSGLIMLMFPRYLLAPERIPSPRWPRPEAIGIGLVMLALFLYAEALPIPFTRTFPPLFEFGRLPGAIALTIYIVAALWILSASLRYDRQLLAQASWRKALVVFILYYLTAKALFAFAGAPGGLGTLQHFLNTALLASNAPFIFLVAHAVYFGPAILIAILRWRQVCDAMSETGFAVVLIGIYAIIHMANPETRFFGDLLPIIALVIAMAVRDVVWIKFKMGVLIALSVLASKLWLPIDDAARKGNWMEWTEQLYYMNIGPWIWTHAYILQACLIALSTLILAFILAPPRRGDLA